MRNKFYVVLMVGLVLAAGVTDAIAGGQQKVPEINPGSLSSGLALLAGGVLLARARWRK
jgi:hypothetical protein